ncbi:MAG: tRNA dihydrouridine(20/20a) synthase DusA [Pseudomonadota bacterium]|nr:tRNA dihydrouridine(20/20a) synthase DusA [Pseudomonadota bacterium]
MSLKILKSNRLSELDRRVSIAPMMDRTDRHERYFLRLISPSVLLYTEMTTTGAIIRGDRERFLKFNDAEHPVALQLGGADADDLSRCAEIAAGYGYDEINLNVGCPSDRVQNARFGACLMKQPEIVAAGVKAMCGAVGLPITIKTRIGVDDHDSWDELLHFVETVAEGGCETFIIHARKAWLKGLSPRENREIPPLSYDTVYRLKQLYPEFSISINGGIKTVEEINLHLQHVDGVMIGRAAYENPWLLADIENDLLGGAALSARDAVIDRYADYIDREMATGVPFYAMARHVLGLYLGVRGARLWRRHISEKGPRPDASSQILRDAVAHVLAPA